MASEGGNDDAPPNLLWRLLPPWLRNLPADLAATVALVILTDLAVLLPGVSETPIRIVLGLPFVLFLPGWAFIAALFPEVGESPVAEDTILRQETSRVTRLRATSPIVAASTASNAWRSRSRSSRSSASS